MAMVPEVIKAAAKKAGINLSDSGPSGMPQGAATYMQPELQTAYQNRDYNTIRNYAQMMANDIQPIYSNINNNDTQAFNSYQEDGTLNTVYISISGDTKSPNGYMWAYIPNPLGSGATGSGQVAFTPVTQFGTLSMSAGFLNISNSTWGSDTMTGTAASIAAAAFRFVFKAIKKSLGRQVDEPAAQDAADEGADEAVEEGEVGDIAVGELAASALGFVAGAIVGVLVFLVVMAILDELIKDFELDINIYNWDQSDRVWTVEQEFGSNEVIVGPNNTSNFQQGVLNSPTLFITLPNGYQQKVANPEVSVAKYVFTNSDTFVNGVGVALRVTCSDGNGFLLGYEIHAMSDNVMALMGNQSETTQDFYNNDNDWCPNETTSFTTTCDGNNVALFATTDALGGADNNTYQYDVHIGLSAAPPSKVANSPAQPQKVKVQRSKPNTPRTKKTIEDLPWPPKIPVVVGDHVLYPDGSTKPHDGKIKLPNGTLQAVKPVKISSK